MKDGRYDARQRRRAKRSGRERGCWAYIPAEELERAGFAPGDPPPFYLTTAHKRSKNAASVIVSLHREP